MAPNFLKYLPHGFVAAATLFLIGADASPRAARESASRLTRSFTWFDGKNEQTVWLDESLVVEFASSADSSSHSPLQEKYRAALPVDTNQGAVRVWKVGRDAEGITRSMNEQTDSSGYPARFSPVLRDASGGSSRMRALPGNIIVYLNPSWSLAEVNAWAQRGQLKVLQKLEFGPNIFLLSSDPGLASLRAANALYLSGEVVAAMPNWWLEHDKR